MEPAPNTIFPAFLSAIAWLPGSRDDIPQLLRELEILVLGSAREGISNTVLEAMVTALPAIASATGENLELPQDGVSGRLLTPRDPDALARALLAYGCDPAMRAAHGAAARARAVGSFSLAGMIAGSQALYNGQCAHEREAA
jgi:glycosyltransferase involved in cell wall biosynthesis